jgi:hypothetical protein
MRGAPSSPASNRGQARSASLLEAITNVAAGFLLAFLVQGFLYPALGINATAQENLMIAAVFSALSIIRSYLVRRAFDTMGKT